MYMFILPNFKIYMYSLWVFCLHANLYIYMDSIVFRDMYVYFLCCQNIHIPWNIIILKWKICDDFHVFKIYDLKEYWALLPFSWCHVPHKTSALTSFEYFSHEYGFMSFIWTLWILECFSAMWFTHISWKIFLIEGFRTSFQTFSFN